MPGVTSDKPSEFTASDILAAGAWSARGARPALGLDVTCTKIAVDLQNMARETLVPVVARSLEALREATVCDAAFVAMLGESAVNDVHVARGTFAQTRLEELRGTALADLPWLCGRLEHLRLSELRDTAAPKKESRAEARCFASLKVGSTLFVAFRVQGRPAGILGLANTMARGPWDVNIQLLLKLLGTSLATGIERVRLATRLDDLEVRVGLAQAAANEGMWDFDTETNVVTFSQRWKEMLGYSDDDLAGPTDWRALVHPEDMSRVQAAMREHVEGQTPICESIHRMRHRSGEWRWVVSRAKAHVDQAGRLLRLVGMEIDITERKLYEEALFREKESAQITLQSIGDGVITSDANSVIDYINPIAEELTGWRLEDATVYVTLEPCPMCAGAILQA
ncbi:MAG TPA: PAS domain S-box protein, partial [Steroidobacteraceae bacterium]|nr:PAS domain S-box protein [Steroidobacteraceae bacterium]